MTVGAYSWMRGEVEEVACFEEGEFFFAMAEREGILIWLFKCGYLFYAAVFLLFSRHVGVVNLVQLVNVSLK